MSTTISTKKKWISTDAWRGYEQPINAVAGANDTGSYSDSPCPSSVCKEELNRFKKKLKEEKIPFRQMVCRSSNVFCACRYILTHPENRIRAAQIASEMSGDTSLLYSITD